MTDTTLTRTAVRGTTKRMNRSTYKEEVTGTPASRFQRHVVLVGLGIVMLYPLLWMLSASMKPSTEVFTDASLIPANPSLDNYAQGWTAQEQPFHVYIFSSLLIAGLNIVGNMISCSMAAYAFSRLRFRSRNFFFSIMMGTMLLPSQVVLIPQYIIFSKLGWMNTYLPLTVPAFFATNAFFIFLLIQFMRNLPMDLQEAAKIDGAGAFRTYWSVILPLTTPAMATVAIFTFIASWGDFFGPLLYLTDPNLFTVPLALKQFISSTGASAWGPMFAMSVVSLIPVVAFFFMGQRYLINGIATTGMK